MGRQVIMLKGLPASGKSTWAKERVLSGQGKYSRVNQDDLGRMLMAGKRTKGGGKILARFRDTLILQILEEGKSVIIDDTNLNPALEEHYRKMVKEYNKGKNKSVQFVVKEFTISVEEAISRDLARVKSVGSDVIWDMARRWGYAPPLAIPEITKENRDPDLPWCLIYDLDGTAAIKGDRCPYDASQCDEIDRPNLALKAVLCAMQGSQPESHVTQIAFSARKETDRAPTERFLEKHGFPFDALHLRGDDDNRKDAVVKREMYDQHVAGKYNVLVVFDDRQQVVDMWRQDLDLPCFQVNYGHF